MNSNRIRDAVLTAIGGAALLVYVLACTSFSPDDTKVLFTSIDADSKAPAIDVYDREAGRTERLLTLPGKSDRDGFVRAVWSEDGRRVIAFSAVAIILLPFKTRESVRVLPWPSSGEVGFMNMVRMPAVRGSHLFFLDEAETRRGAETVKQPHLVRMNLETREQKTVNVTDETAVLGQGGEVYYMRRLKPPADEKEAIEFGRVEPETLAFSARVQFAILDEHDFGALLFAVSADGKRAAFVSEDGDRTSCQIYDGAKLTAIVPLGGKGVHLGGPMFSANGSVLYVTYCEKTEEAPPEPATQRWGILEVPVRGGATRKIPLFSGRGAVDRAEVLVFQLDVSHDGKTAAACSSMLVDHIEPKDLALYLVDLSHPDRKVTKVPIPAPPKPVAATGN